MEIFESGNLLYHREGDHLSQGGVGFIVHKSLVNNVEKIDEMCEDISRIMHSFKTHYTVLMGDLNAKLGTKENGELKVGKFGIGQRNPRGQQLADFMKEDGLFMMNSFIQKWPERKWTWSSPDGSTKTKIVFIMTT